jgi:hypothetical protein
VEISVFFKDCLQQSGTVNWSLDNRGSTVQYTLSEQKCSFFMCLYYNRHLTTIFGIIWSETRILLTTVYVNYHSCVF